MSIFGAVYYDKCTTGSVTPEWVRSERYEYCDGFYENVTGKKEGKFLQAVKTLLLTVY